MLVTYLFAGLTCQGRLLYKSGASMDLETWTVTHPDFDMPVTIRACQVLTTVNALN